MSEEKVHAWITKYALTKGIIEIDGTVERDSPRALAYRFAGSYTNYVHGNQWHRTKVAAEARVAEMVEAKKASLRKQLAKLESFKVKYAKETDR